MKQITDKFLSVKNRFVRFVIVGIINTAFGAGVYSLLLWIGISYPLAILLSTILGILFNFKTMGALVFENRNNKLIFRFFVSYAFVYLVNLGIVKTLVTFTSLNSYYAGIITMPIVALLSFVIQTKFVFNTPKNNEKN